MVNSDGESFDYGDVDRGDEGDGDGDGFDHGDGDAVMTIMQKSGATTSLPGATTSLPDLYRIL